MMITFNIRNPTKYEMLEAIVLLHLFHLWKWYFGCVRAICQLCAVNASALMFARNNLSSLYKLQLLTVYCAQLNIYIS